MVFIISYDLRKPDFDYKDLYEELASINASHIQDSVWAVRSDNSAKQVFEALWQYMHSDKDRLFVVPFDKDESYRARNSINMLKNV